MQERNTIEIRGAHEHNLKHLDLSIPRAQITVVTGVSGSGKSSLAFDTVLAEANRRFFYTLSHYSRQFLDLGSRPALRSASGLSPAIALAQNETQPSVRATVASLTDLGELLGVLYARFAEKRCPKHDLPTEARSVDEMCAHVRSQYFGRNLLVTVTLAQAKKGQFRKQFEDFAKKGFARAYVDGAMVALDPIPQLNKDEKHDIAIIIDALKVDPSREARLKSSLEMALKLGEGIVSLYLADAKGQIDPKSVQHLSKEAGCPTCAFSWPRLDSRHFSANSLGRCPTCDGRGVIEDWEDEGEASDDELGAPLEPCKVCQGTGLMPDLRAILYRGRSLHRHYQSSVRELQAFIRESLETLAPEPSATRVVLEHIKGHLDRMLDIGLGYLQLSRRIRSLSHGEAQRLRLSSILGEQLRGVLYVLDEPSQGLHPTEIASIWDAFARLKQQGNTLLIVDHDPDIIRRADWIIDLGPSGGSEGGHLMAQFAPQDAARYAQDSLTARYLLEKAELRPKSKSRVSSDSSWLTLEKVKLHTVDIPKVRFPLGALTVVTGPSGAGKNTLVLQTLYRNLAAQLGSKSKKAAPLYACKDLKGIEALGACTLITRKPIAKSSVSMPATYLDIFTELRNLFASVPEAQIYGLSASSFSLSQEEGRCGECKGKGRQQLTMRFLADATVECPLCQGKRYKPHLLDVRYSGLNMADVLDLSIAEAYETFKHHRLLERRLRPAVDLGLGYLKLGQPSSSLSGGESQRLKLSPYLSKKPQPGTLLIMDEPTAGLHVRDVERLLQSLEVLIDQGVSVIILEHDAQVIAAADWVIRLGPGSGEDGGRLVSEGVH